MVEAVDSLLGFAENSLKRVRQPLLTFRKSLVKKTVNCANPNEEMG
jgi:hypothetical protein